MGNKNIIFNYTLEQYNKKYRNRRHRLLKYTKKQIEDFDKQYGFYIFNNKTYSLEFNYYLLKDRKWALIGDTYYEIPKPVRFTWFRNLNAGVQAISCLAGAGVIATAVALPIIVINQKQNYDVSVDNIDRLDYKNKGYDKDGNILLYVKAKGSDNIDSLTLSVENYVLTEGEDYSYNVSTGDLVIDKKVIKEHPGKLNIKPTFLPTIITFSLSQKSIVTCTDDTQTVEIVYDDWRYSKNVKSIEWIFSDPTKVSDIVYSNNKNIITFKTASLTEGNGITLTAKITSKKDIVVTDACNIKIDNKPTFTLPFVIAGYEIESTSKVIAQNENIRITCKDVGYGGFRLFYMGNNGNYYTFSSTDDTKDVKITKLLVNDTTELTIGAEGTSDAWINNENNELIFENNIFGLGDKLTIEATVKRTDGISVGTNIRVTPKMILADAYWRNDKNYYMYSGTYTIEKNSILSLYSKKTSTRSYKTGEFTDTITSAPFTIGYRDSTKDISILDVYCNGGTRLRIGDKGIGDYWIENGKLKINPNISFIEGKNIYVNTKVYKENGIQLTYKVL